ncbi:hypothetical protein JOD54_000844 [Actinokineospora baliensis]|nr:hypothetical protein [Actinokineospora baliensis]
MPPRTRKTEPASPAAEIPTAEPVEDPAPIPEPAEVRTEYRVVAVLADGREYIVRDDYARMAHARSGAAHDRRRFREAVARGRAEWPTYQIEERSVTYSAWRRLERLTEK